MLELFSYAHASTHRPARTLSRVQRFPVSRRLTEYSSIKTGSETIVAEAGDVEKANNIINTGRDGSGESYNQGIFSPQR